MTENQTDVPEAADAASAPEPTAEQQALLDDLEEAMRDVVDPELGINVDRGRLVREALDIMLADLAANGADSDIAQRLRQ